MRYQCIVVYTDILTSLEENPLGNFFRERISCGVLDKYYINILSCMFIQDNLHLYIISCMNVLSVRFMYYIFYRCIVVGINILSGGEMPTHRKTDSPSMYCP